ncbi:aspartic peptidase domain-containing protein [Chytriomyces cf. hyalinus JEL632]|nr:aspartic peptidase domain-containing protein [Chytriomyces cf. hyalinus JEL632]
MVLNMAWLAAAVLAHTATAKSPRQRSWKPAPPLHDPSTPSNPSSEPLSVVRVPLLYQDPLTMDDEHPQPKAMAASRAALSRKYSAILAQNDLAETSRSKLINALNAGYYASISVGTPPLQFYVNADTGSADLWITGSKCVACTTMNKALNAELSSTYSILDANAKPRNLTYGTGSVVGIPSKETISWSQTTISVTNQPFLLVTNQDAAMKQALVGFGDGVMGLAYQDGLDPSRRHDTLIYQLIAQKKISVPIFSMWLNQSSMPVISQRKKFDEYGGQILFGGVDPKLYTGSFTFFPVIPISLPNKSGGTTQVMFYWTVPMQGVSKVGGNIISPPKDSAMFMDSGTSLITMDSASVQALVISLGVPNAVLDEEIDMYVIPCAQARLLPDIVFHIGTNGTAFPLSSADYIVATGDKCVLAIQVLDPSAHNGRVFWIMGGPFMRRYYSLYDLQNGQVGLARASNGLVPGDGVALTKDALTSSTAAYPKYSSACCYAFGGVWWWRGVAVLLFLLVSM